MTSGRPIRTDDTAIHELIRKAVLGVQNAGDGDVAMARTTVLCEPGHDGGIVSFMLRGLVANNVPLRFAPVAL